MTLEELRSHLSAILAKEEASPIDWVSVDRLCLELIGRLRKGKEPPFPHDVAYHYLDDPDIRRKDEAYGLGRLGGANNCLLVVVTDRALIVSPFFPFNLMFLPELLGLELSVPLSNIRRVEVRRRLLRSSLIVETSDGRRIGLHLREPEAFQAALKRTGSASRS